MNRIKTAASDDGRLFTLEAVARTVPRAQASSLMPVGQIDWKTRPEGHLAKPRGGGEFYIAALKVTVREV